MTVFVKKCSYPPNELPGIAEFVLPNMERPPAKPGQLIIDNQVTLDVLPKFCPPEQLVTRWSRVVQWTAVPKTSIHKYSRSPPRKGEIWAARKVVQETVPKARPPQDFP
jgi:hypothetical protein